MTEPKPCYDGGTCRNADLVEELNARIADYIEGAEKVISDKCPTDERHCGCVPILRMATQCYQNALVLITTLPDCEEAKKIAENALKKKGVDLQISEARACGEYWVNQLYMLDDKYVTLEKDYKDVCQKRIEAADSFSKRIVELETELKQWDVLKTPQTGEALMTIILYIKRHFDAEKLEQLFRACGAMSWVEMSNRVKELEAQLRWIPVSERLPDVYIPVEIEFVHVGVCGTFHTTGQREGEWTFMHMIDEQICYDPLPDIFVVTRWRPLPEVGE